MQLPQRLAAMGVLAILLGALSLPGLRAADNVRADATTAAADTRPVAMHLGAATIIECRDASEGQRDRAPRACTSAEASSGLTPQTMQAAWRRCAVVAPGSRHGCIRELMGVSG
ncbi:MAG TPA: hypothetical protein VN680_12055 [Burkholderiaceae bacterium]|jgi:hypothetical protein|nr:hypothetical protein [Burkholderiaceae bacterium]